MYSFIDLNTFTSQDVICFVVTVGIYLGYHVVLALHNHKVPHTSMSSHVDYFHISLGRNLGFDHPNEKIAVIQNLRSNMMIVAFFAHLQLAAAAVVGKAGFHQSQETAHLIRSTVPLGVAFVAYVAFCFVCLAWFHLHFIYCLDSTCGPSVPVPPPPPASLAAPTIVQLLPTAAAAAALPLVSATGSATATAAVVPSGAVAPVAASGAAALEQQRANAPTTPQSPEVPIVHTVPTVPELVLPAGGTPVAPPGSGAPSRAAAGGSGTPPVVTPAAAAAAATAAAEPPLSLLPLPPAADAATAATPTTTTPTTPPSRLAASPSASLQLPGTPLSSALKLSPTAAAASAAAKKAPKRVTIAAEEGGRVSLGPPSVPSPLSLSPASKSRPQFRDASFGGQPLAGSGTTAAATQPDASLAVAAALAAAAAAREADTAASAAREAGEKADGVAYEAAKLQAEEAREVFLERLTLSKLHGAALFLAASWHLRNGWRMTFLAVVLMLWTVSPWAMMVTGVFMTAHLAWNDFPFPVHSYARFLPNHLKPRYETQASTLAAALALGALHDVPIPDIPIVRRELRHIRKELEDLSHLELRKHMRSYLRRLRRWNRALLRHSMGLQPSAPTPSGSVCQSPKDPRSPRPGLAGAVTAPPEMSVTDIYDAMQREFSGSAVLPPASVLPIAQAENGTGLSRAPGASGCSTLVTTNGGGGRGRGVTTASGSPPTADNDAAPTESESPTTVISDDASPRADLPVEVAVADGSAVGSRPPSRLSVASPLTVLAAATAAVTATAAGGTAASPTSSTLVRAEIEEGFRSPVRGVDGDEARLASSPNDAAGGAAVAMPAVSYLDGGSDSDDDDDDKVAIDSDPSSSSTDTEMPTLYRIQSLHRRQTENATAEMIRHHNAQIQMS